MDLNGLKNKLLKHLSFLYKEHNNNEEAEIIIQKIVELQAALDTSTNYKRWDEKDSILITYGDSIYEEDKAPLESLSDFLDVKLNDAISTVHILPFFPYSSDDGFSVIDFREVNPILGNWGDIMEISKNFRLMSDLVINHASSKSSWFESFLKDEEPFTNYFLQGDPKKDYSDVIRPRSHPLLTPFKTKNGTKYLWTTFSEDQIDLNFKFPGLLMEMLDILFFYIEMGVRIIRLDAIAFLWKEDNSNCLHLPETHEVVKLLRTIFSAISPELILLTETNVPNKENLSYFGDNDEAHMVYQFTLPPLLLNTLYTGNSKILSEWAKSIPMLKEDQTFFNFTASHDGIGVRPLEGIVDSKEVDELIEGMKRNGAFISEKSNSDGSTSPYEINITYFDACKTSKCSGSEFQIDRFVCSQTIMMSLQGIPAFYIHSLLGTENDMEGYNETKRNRTVNRKRWNWDKLELLLESNTNHKKVFNELTRRIIIRKETPLFSPLVKQEILFISEKLFVIKRYNNEEELIALFNISSNMLSLEIGELSQRLTDVYDLLTEDEFSENNEIVLTPYQCRWLISN